MPQQIVFPQWREQNEPTKYPFSATASLTSLENRILLEGTFLDAAIYLIGAKQGVYLKKVTIDHQTVQFEISDRDQRVSGYGRFSLIHPPATVALKDSYGRPAGMLLSDPQRLSIFQSWGVGSYEFLPDATEFCAVCCFPTPEVGVRGILLEDGSFLTGDVWLIGSDGVVLRTETAEIQEPCSQVSREVKVIRLDVIGDPLFRRRLCEDENLFQTPRFIREIRVEAPNGVFQCGPDENGDIKLFANNTLATDTLLRVVPQAHGIYIAAVGDRSEI